MTTPLNRLELAAVRDTLEYHDPDSLIPRLVATIDVWKSRCEAEAESVRLCMEGVRAW